MARNPLQSSTPLAASTPLPSWWNNPIGTQRDDQTYATATRPDESFDPVVGYWPTGKPMLKSEYDGMQNASLALFDRLSMVGGSAGRAVNPFTAMPKGRLRAGNLDKSRYVGQYPMDKPQRALAEDYRQGVSLDDTGRIARTIEGVPLTAQNVAGRRTMDNHGSFPDRGLDAKAIESIGTGVRGAQFLGVPPSRLDRNTVGTYDPRTGKVQYNNSLSTAQQGIVKAHEVGHIIDEIAGSIPTKGLDTQLRDIYHTLYEGKERKTLRTGPEHFKYKPPAVRGELMAEAMRAYLQDPNYMKSVAPKVAAAIRKAVNTNPDLNKWIQFNTLAGVAGGTAMQGSE